jgi:hypothetical protein
MPRLRSTLSIIGSLLALVCGTPPILAQSVPTLEHGAAITDPAGLRELDRGPFGLSRLLQPARAADLPLADSELFALPSMAPVREALDAEFDRYIQAHQAELPNESIGVGTSFDFQLFDRALLYSPDTRFVLAGIVNRMDRAYVAPANCGEIRLIYRLTRTDTKAADTAGDEVLSPRLPMTLNLVLKAKADHAAVTCAEIARRWLAAGDWPLTGAELAAKLTSKEGPLELIGPDNIERIETNLQIVHAPKSGTRDFRTDYLLKVFDCNSSTRTFEEATLENQIDRDRILSDAKLRRDFKMWLLNPAHFSKLDRGTVLVPPEFLATRAIAPTPSGFSSTRLQPAFGLVQVDTGATGPVFTESDVVTALKKAAERGIHLQNIASVAGFERRLNDITCSGCHQTRGIGGFHFPGVDWMAAKPSNSTIVPASPHFFGDQIRRRDILVSLRDGKTPDYSRGFSSRPQLRASRELAGTEYDNGWGAPCYLPGAKGSEKDRSFTSWTCAKGLACQVLDQPSRMGMCFVGTR